MENETKCYLLRTDNEQKIDLVDGIEYILGRNPETNLTDTLVSKKQLSCTLDTKKFRIRVQYFGANMSGINGFALRKNIVYNVTHKDVIEVLLNKICYEVNFDPPPTIPNIVNSKDTVHNCGDNGTVNKKTVEKLNSDKKTDSINKDKQNNKNEDVKCSRENDIVLKRPAEKATYSLFEKKQCNEFNWNRLYDGKLQIMTHKEVVGRNKIAAYDIDGTIIKTKSGLVFPKDINDWKIAFTEVPQKLKQLHSDNFKIVFFTNQKGIKIGKIIFRDFKNKLERIATKIGCPIQAFIATDDDIHRKPAVGMWNELLKYNDGMEIDKTQSFFCGDAAGRMANWMPKAKKDHSLADRLFARNIGLTFYTPEEHFLNQKPVEFSEPSFDPKKITSKSLIDPPEKKLISDKQEILLLVGFQASGKTFICESRLIPAGYQWINRDTLKSATNCIQNTVKAIQAGKSVVIDNTNIDPETRKQYIDIANKYSVPIRCAIMNTTIENALHNNMFRKLTDKNHQLISPQLLKVFKSKYVEPTLDEGFTDIIKINFIPKFKDDSTKSLYEMYLIEK